MSQQASYLILGGTGFIGRHLVYYILKNNLALAIRVVDKVIPSLAYLNEEHKEAFSNPKVEFVSANLLSSIGLGKAFSSKLPFDYVINCAGETRHGMGESIYYEGIVALSTCCAKYAAENDAKRYIELSSGCLASNGVVPHKETDPTEPWTAIASCKLLAEEAIMTTPGLRYTILRPAAVYGTDDRTSVTPRLIMGAIYRQLEQTMKLIWSRNLKMNTVHVYDLCRAICFVIDKSEAEGQIYNVVDVGYTTQGIINDMMAEIFGISMSYIDGMLTSLYKLDVETIIEEINEKHSTPWAQLCEKNSIINTPLSSFLHKEGLLNKHLNMDGNKLFNLGFTLQYPKITKELLLEILGDYRKRNLFPK